MRKNNFLIFFNFAKKSGVNKKINIYPNKKMRGNRIKDSTSLIRRKVLRVRSVFAIKRKIFTNNEWRMPKNSLIRSFKLLLVDKEILWFISFMKYWTIWTGTRINMAFSLNKYAARNKADNDNISVLSTNDEIIAGKKEETNIDNLVLTFNVCAITGFIIELEIFQVNPAFSVF